MAISINQATIEGVANDLREFESGVCRKGNRLNKIFSSFTGDEKIEPPITGNILDLPCRSHVLITNSMRKS